MECLGEWRELGYKLFILGEDDYGLADRFERVSRADFKGCVWANNLMIDKMMGEADLVWVGSDDYYPDKRYSAEDVASIYKSVFPKLDGVMEAGDGKRPYERELAIAPIIGSAYIEKHRPTWPDGYYHFCADRELAIIASKEGAFINEKRLKFNHRHWSITGEAQPEHMERWERLYVKDRDVFRQRWGPEL